MSHTIGLQKYCFRVTNVTKYGLKVHNDFQLPEIVVEYLEGTIEVVFDTLIC